MTESEKFTDRKSFEKRERDFLENDGPLYIQDIFRRWHIMQHENADERRWLASEDAKLSGMFYAAMLGLALAFLIMLGSCSRRDHKYSPLTAVADGPDDGFRALCTWDYKRHYKLGTRVTLRCREDVSQIPMSPPAVPEHVY